MTEQKVRRNSDQSAAKDHGPIDIQSIEQFERFLDDEQPTVVDFWAPWCAPCRMMAPVFAKVAEQFEGKVRFVKVDTERFPQLGDALQIRSIPTIVAFDGRDVVDVHTGMASQGMLRKMAQGLISEEEGLSAKLRRWLGLQPQAAS